MPESSGWQGLPFVPCDGQNWPLAFAARFLDIPERSLREQVRKRGVEPAGVIQMADFRRSGRQPMAYPAAELITIAESFRLPQPELDE